MELSKVRTQLSSHRSYLMGMAIVWIMIHHAQFFGLCSFGILDFYARIGSCGVDIFLFVSGFGIYYSLLKGGSLKNFYFRRLLRIVPFFIMVMILLKMHSPLDLLSVRYWYSSLFSNWYIPFIFLMYVISPLIYHVQSSKQFLPLSLSVAVSALLTIVLIKYDRDDIHQVPMLMSQRLPIFTAGMMFADKRFDYEFSDKIVWGGFVLVLMMLYLCFYAGYEYLVYPLFFFLTVGIVLVLPSIWIEKLDRFLQFSGTISLELYLVHMALIPIVMRYNSILPSFVGIEYIVFACIIVLTYGISVAINKVMNPVRLAILNRIS